MCDSILNRVLSFESKSIRVSLIAHLMLSTLYYRAGDGAATQARRERERYGLVAVHPVARGRVQEPN